MEEQEKLDGKSTDNLETEHEVCDSESVAEAETETNAPVNTIDYAEVKSLIDSHFATVKNLIRYNKEKDANVLALSKQLQTYRDGLENTLFKRVAMEFIEYREGCRKSYRELAGKTISVQETEKYINYLKLDFEDLLENLDIRIVENAVFYNKKDINDEPQKIEFSEIPQIGEIELKSAQIEITDFEKLAKFLQESETAICEMIKNNTVLDLALKDYIAASAIYEQGLYQVILYPVIRHIVKIYVKLSDRIRELKIDDLNATSCYAEQLTWIIGEIDELLEICNVSIDPFVSDIYDSKKQRILKMIETEDAELNGHVICRYTDCYLMDDKVVYLSKVDVYKTKKN